MGERSTPASTLEAAIGTSDLNAPDIFAALGNRTRLAILIVLWEAYDPWAADERNALPYSELRDRVGIQQGGEFNYHLNQLTGQLVEKFEFGYTLHQAGLNLVQSVIAGLYRDEHYPETALDRDCPFCGAQVSITYDEGHLIQRCAGCEGSFTDDPEVFRDGAIAVTNFPPAGLVGRSAEELAAAGVFRQRLFAALMMGGVCPTCAGRVDAIVDPCEDHAPGDDGYCESCDRRFDLYVETICSVCKRRWRGPAIAFAMRHPAAIGFYYRRGLDISFGITGFHDLRRLLELDVEQELASTDPVRVKVGFRMEDDELWLVLDESMTVIDVDDLT